MIEPRLSPAQPARPRALTGRRARLLWFAAWLLLALAVGAPVAVLGPAAWAGAPTADRVAGPDPGPDQAQPPTRPFPRIESGQHTAPIYRIGVDAQGRWLVTASHDKTARVWDLGSGALLRVLRPPIGEGDEGKLCAAAMSPDGATVAVGGWTGYEWDRQVAIYLFDRDSGQLRHRIGGLPNVVNHLAFSSDGSRLAAALGEGGIRLYSAGDWTEIGRDPDYGSRSHGIAFDRQGRIAATECGDGRPGRLHLYGPDLRPTARVETPGGYRLSGVAFSPDGGRIAVGYDDSTAVGLFSGDDLKALPGPDTSGIGNGGLSSVAWSRDGRTLFAGGRYISAADEKLVAWPDAGTGRPARHRLATNAIMDLVPLGDGRLVFGATDPAWGVWRDPATQGSAGADHPGAGPAVATLAGAGPGPAPGRGPAILDFRRPSQVLRLSADGLVADVDCRVLDSDGSWRVHRLRLDLSQRRLSLDPPLSESDGILGQFLRWLATLFSGSTPEARGIATVIHPPPLTGPEIRVPGLTVTDWWDSLAPKLNGKPLGLKPLENAISADIAPDGSRVLLGTEWFLRAYAADGTPSWQTPAPSFAMMVNLSDNGRWAVAAFGDGSIRWFEAATGRERLALFVDGAAIAARDLAAAPGTPPEPAPGKNPGEDWEPPWVLWTPDGFYESGGGGERLMGWHLNRGPDQAADFVGADRIGEVFHRPDLIALALDPGYPELAAKALKDIGDLGRLLTEHPAPLLVRADSGAPILVGRELEVALVLKDQGGGVGRIEYRLDGAVVGRTDARGGYGPGLPGRDRETRRFTLAPGRHRIEARGFEAGNRVASEPLVWELEVAGQSGRPSLYGLAVGIGPYKMPELNLKYGGSDARALSAVLPEIQGGLFERVDVRPLLDAQATLAGIRAAFLEQAAKTGPDDVFVLYLAGHGLALDGRYHFLPWDLVYSNGEALRAGSLNEEGLRDLLARVQARKVLVVLDSCYSGGALAGAADPGPRLAGVARGGENQGMALRAAIDRLKDQTGRAVLARSRPDQVALEGIEGHGVFTHVLLAGLHGEADAKGNRNQEIEVSELADYLEREVPRVSQERFGYAMFPMRDLQGQSFTIGRAAGVPPP
jgi:hypothetical protein